MQYIRITSENIDSEHICCAMSGKQSVAKKAWLKERFAEGLVFYRSEERGKCFIEYIPAENAWVPIDAPGYLYINCLWIAGSMKGHGYSSDLLNECIRDAKAQGRQGICILSAEGRKREFLSDPKYLAYKGFTVADTSDCGITLMYLPLTPSAERPKFKKCAKHPQIGELYHGEYDRERLIYSLRSYEPKQSSRATSTDMFVSIVRKYTRARKLTPRMLNELVEKIEVYNAEKIDGEWVQRLRIHYNCVGEMNIPNEPALPIPAVTVNTRKGVFVSYTTDDRPAV